MAVRVRWVFAFVLIPAVLVAQNSPLTGTTLRSTSSSVISACIGCPLGSVTPVINSSVRAASITLQPLAAPADPANRLYSLTGGVLTWQGNVAWGGVNITDLTGAPTINSGFGSGPTIAGRDYGFLVVLGSTPGTGGTITFSAAYANAPICTASATRADAAPSVATSTTQVILGYGGTTLVAGDGISVLCRGY